MKELPDDFISTVLKNWTAHYTTPRPVRKRLLNLAKALSLNYPAFNFATASIYTVLPQNLSQILVNLDSPQLQLELTWKRHIVC